MLFWLLALTPTSQVNTSKMALWVISHFLWILSFEAAEGLGAGQHRVMKAGQRSMLLGQMYSFYEFDCLVELVVTYIDWTLLRLALVRVTMLLIFVIYSDIQTNIDFEAVHYGQWTCGLQNPFTYHYISGWLVHVTFCLFFILIIKFNVFFVDMKRMQRVEQLSFQVQL